MIAPDKQWQEHNNLATIQRGKLKVAHERCKSLEFVTPKSQMQTLKKVDKTIIEDFDHMTTMDEIMNCTKSTS